MDPAARGGDGPSTVLVVDDDFDIRQMLSLALELDGFRVLSAANGEEALSLLRQGPRAELILLDLMMPVMNGSQFRTEQRRDPDLWAIPVVVLTGNGSAGNAVAGAAGYLRKPIDVDDLLATVRTVCAQRPLPPR